MRGVRGGASAVAAVQRRRIDNIPRRRYRGRPFAGFAAMNHRRTAALAALLSLTGCAATPSRAYLERVELLAQLQTLNADLLSHDSATLTLERWCAAHRLADPARVVARRVETLARPIPDDLRARLGVGADEPLGYRRVQLTCGTHVLSEADNWYVPGRLTPEMNHRLDATDEPFGKVVRPLGFQRRTLSAELLWQPLPEGWETRPRGQPDAAPPPREVLRHVALLTAPERGGISVVVETYTAELLARAADRR